VGEGVSYVIQESDINTRLYFVVTYPDNSTDASNLTCFDIVYPSINRNWFLLQYNQTFADNVILNIGSTALFQTNGDMWLEQRYKNCNSANIHNVTADAVLNWSFEFRPDSSEDSFNDNNGLGRTFIIDGGADILEIFYERYTFPAPAKRPSRLYRFNVSKTTGTVLSTRTIVYSPVYTTINNDVIRNIVKVNEDYYIMQTLTDDDLSNVCIFKFDTNLNLVWDKRLVSRIRPSANSSACTVFNRGISSDFRENNGELIGSSWLSGFLNVPASLFSISLDGDTYNILPAIVSRAEVYPQQQPVGVRSMDRDTNGDFYGVGGFQGQRELGVLDSRIIVFKQSSAGTLLWASDLWPSLLRGVVVLERQLLVINDKLVFAGAFNAAATVPITYNVVIAILDLTTGQIETIVRVRHNLNESGSTGQIGQELQLNKMSQPTGFIVQTAMGYRFRFDLTNLPVAGTYNFTDTVGSYIVTYITPIQQSRLSELQTQGGACANFSFVDTTLSPYFSVNTTISGVQYPPSGTVSITRTAVV
jgi:hypothetical protein